jgi:hypothetical protein
MDFDPRRERERERRAAAIPEAGKKITHPGRILSTGRT